MSKINPYINRNNLESGPYKNNLEIRWTGLSKGGLNKDTFEKFLKFFGDKENDRITLSKFLENSDNFLGKIKGIKIGINYIRNFEARKAKQDLPMEFQGKIAKLYLNKLYSVCVAHKDKNKLIPMLNTAFDINVEEEENLNLEKIRSIIAKKKQINFSTLKVDISKLGDEFTEIVDNLTISNVEIFHSLGINIKENSKFSLLNPSLKDDVLNLLQFESNELFEYMKSWGENLEKDMKNVLLPLNGISDIFNEINNSKISELKLKRGGIEEILFLDEDEIKAKDTVFWIDYVEKLKKQGVAEDIIKILNNRIWGELDYLELKQSLNEYIESIDKQIWLLYIEELKKLGKSPDFLKVLVKFYLNKFDFSVLSREEQTILWQNLVINNFSNDRENSRLKHTGIDQEDYKDFLKDVYDFGKEDLSMDVLGVGKLNLKVNKEIKKIGRLSDEESNQQRKKENKKGENSTVFNLENFENIDETSPLVYTVDISDNDESMIQILEDTEDSPLRENGIMETHIINSKKVNIGNGYTLKICGKIITKAQFDKLLDCDGDADKLEGELREVGLYGDLKNVFEQVKKNRLKKTRDIDSFYNELNDEQKEKLEKIGKIDHSYIPCLFKDMLKQIDVEVVERKLILEGKDINKLSQLYIMHKLRNAGENGQLLEQQDENDGKILNLFNSNSKKGEIGKLKGRLLNKSSVSLSDFPLNKGNKVSIGGEKCEYLGIRDGLIFKPDNGGEIKGYTSFQELKDAGVKFDLKSRQELGSEQQDVFDELVKIEGLQKRKKELEEICKNLELEIDGLTSNNENGKNDSVVAKKKEELNGVQSELKETDRILDAYRVSDEKKEGLGGKEEGEKYAEDIFGKIKEYIKDNYNGDVMDDDENNSVIDPEIETSIADYWNHLNEKGKESFKNKLYDLIRRDDELDYYVDKEDIIAQIDDMLRVSEDMGETKEELEKKLDIHEKKEEEKSEEEIFQETRKALSGDEKCPFEELTKLYFDLGESQLEPKGSTSYYCFEIVNVGETMFSLKAIGGELKSSLKNKTREFSRTKDSLEQLKDGGKVFKVRSSKTKDRDSCVKNISNSKIFENLNIFGEGNDKIKLKGDKFVKTDKDNNEVEIKYFNRKDWGFDDDAGRQGKKLCKYEVKKVDTSKGTVKVVSNFDGYSENGTPTKYSYENELTFEQFILLVEGKSLLGASNEEQKELEANYEIKDPGRLASKGNRKWISIGAIINVVKNGKKAFDAKIDEHRKEQEETLDNYLYSYEGLNLWSKIGGFADMVGLRSVSSACNELYYDFYTNRENRTWKKIEKWYKIFESEPNYSECFKDVLLPILNEPGCKMYADDYTRYRFAAAFLLMLKKEGPYPRAFSGDVGKGVRVEKFLGPGHVTKFKKHYLERKLEIEQVKNLGYSSSAILERQEELNKMEINYIIAVIDGLAPYNDGINEFESKSIWGLKFKDKLSENFSGYFDKHNETKNKISTFFAAEEQYLRTIGAGRFDKALPSLERMCEKAESPQEAFRAKGYLLSAMLMGVIKNNSSSSTIKSFFNTCRSMGFAPGSWMKDIEHQRKVQILLDGVTNGAFSKDPNLKYNISDFEPGKIKDGKYGFVKKFETYWNANGENILKKIEKPSYKFNSGDKSIMELAADENNPNRSIFSEYISNSRTVDYDTPNNEVGPIWEKTAPWTAISNKVRKYIPNKGYYTNLTKEEDKDDAEKFWTKAAKEVPTGEVDKTVVEDTFMQFFSWFDSKISVVSRPIIKSLKLIQKLKKEGNYREVDFMLSYLIRGNMYRQTGGGKFPKEFEEVVENFRKFFINNVQSIDEGIIERTFKNDQDLVDAYNEGKDMIMFNWGEYKRYKMTNYKGGNGGGGNDRGKYNNLLQYELRKRNYENRNMTNYRELTENDVVNNEIESIWRSCTNSGVTRYPDANISFSEPGILLYPERRTNDEIRTLNNSLTDLENK